MQMGGAHVPLKNGVEAWNDEKKNYHGEKIAEGDFKGYGHYTQVSFVMRKRAKGAVGYGKKGGDEGRREWEGMRLMRYE